MFWRSFCCSDRVLICISCSLVDFVPIAGVGLNLLSYIKVISKTRWLNFAMVPTVVLMAMHGFSLTCCQETHISMLAWNNTYCVISRWTSSGNKPQLSGKSVFFCIYQPSTSHNYLAVGTQRVTGSRLMDTQAFWFVIVIVILSTWGLGNASFEPPLLSPHTYTSTLLLLDGCPLLV